MRRLLLKDLTAIKRKKRLLSISEAFEQDGYIYTAEKKIIFRIKEERSFKDEQTAGNWVTERIKDPDEPKRLALLRVCNQQRQESFWRSKMAGRLYIMRANAVVTVAFIQVLEMGIKHGEAELDI